MYTMPEEWLATIRKEYLHGFIRRGGAAVKFCVPAEGSPRGYMQSALRDIALSEGYVFASADAADVKVHQIDKLFFQLARQIDWDGLAKIYVKKYFLRNGYRLPEKEEDFNIVKVAEINNCEEMQFRNDAKAGIQKDLFYDYGMSQEFRFAMIRLCLNQFNAGGPEDFLSTSVKEWLRGELRLISSLKEALIFQKITRFSARHLLYSLAHWIVVNDKSGLLLHMDISACFAAKGAVSASGGLYYTAPMVLDAYEVLRQFIDGTGEMDGLMLIVQAPPEFIVDEKRGLNRYDALKMRIWNEVRDRQRQNPLASLIRLSATL